MVYSPFPTKECIFATQTINTYIIQVHVYTVHVRDLLRNNLCMWMLISYNYIYIHVNSSYIDWTGMYGDVSS